MEKKTESWSNLAAMLDMIWQKIDHGARGLHAFGAAARIRCANDLFGQPIKGILESFHPLFYLIASSLALAAFISAAAFSLWASVLSFAASARVGVAATGVLGAELSTAVSVSWNHVRQLRRCNSCFL